jgi:hypothetical protein
MKKNSRPTRIDPFSSNRTPPLRGVLTYNYQHYQQKKKEEE